jgi:hypothetical protein
MKPNYSEHGVPFCSEDACPEYDGKRCRALGCRPGPICEPAVIAMARRISRDLESTPPEGISPEALAWLREPSPFEDGEDPDGRERADVAGLIRLIDLGWVRLNATPRGELALRRTAIAPEPPRVAYVEPERSTAIAAPGGPPAPPEWTPRGWTACRSCAGMGRPSALAPESCHRCGGSGEDPGDG